MKSRPILHKDVLHCLKRQQLGDAELLKEMYGESIIYDIEEEKWYFWEGNYWKEDKAKQIYNLLGDKVARRYAQAVAKEHENKDLMSALVSRAALLRQRPYASKVIEWAQGLPGLYTENEIWDGDPYLIACSNCVIDLKNGATRQGVKEDYIRSVIPTEFHGTDLVPERFERFLLEIFDCNTQKIRFFQRILGYALTGLSSEHVLPVLSGQGRNGKDTLVQILEATLGLDVAGPTASEILLGGNKNPGAATPYLYDLRFKRLAYVNETNDGAQLNAGQVKWLTGGSTLTGRPLYGKPIRFKPQHLLLLITNSKPQAPADDYALWKRVFSIEFDISFVDNPLKRNEKKIDRKLHLELEKEKSGILAWLVKGCLMWQQEGLNPPESVLVATEQYRRDEDTIGQFLESQMIFDIQSEIKGLLLYQYYREWTVDNGLRPLGSKRFYQKISLRFDKERREDGYYFLGLEPAPIQADVFTGFE